MTKRLATTGLIILMALTMGGAASAELNAYLRIRGQKQGEVKGGVTQKGREDSIMVIASSHSIVSPRDPASGLPTGKRMHKPFVITKEVDKASPILYRMLTTNENITNFRLQFWKPGANGTEVQYLTIELVNANIASIDLRMLNNKNPELMKYAMYEEIAFTYQKITWTYVEGGITTSDNWESPTACLTNDGTAASPIRANFAPEEFAILPKTRRLSA